MWPTLLCAVLIAAPLSASHPSPSSATTVGTSLLAVGATRLPAPEHLDDLATLFDVAVRVNAASSMPLRAADVADAISAESELWGVVGPEWRDVAGTHAADTLACRETLLGDPIDPCLETLSVTVSFAHAERLRSTIVMRLTMAEGLGSIDRGRVFGGLAIARDRAVERMQRIVAADDVLLDVAGVDRAGALEVGAVLLGIADPLTTRGDGE